MIKQQAADSLRIFGNGINALAVLAFAFLTYKLFGLASHHLAAGGPFPVPSADGIKAFAQLPDVKQRLMHWTLAWFYGIGTAGLGWMTLLGIRWTYHAVLRLLSR